MEILTSDGPETDRDRGVGIMTTELYTLHHEILTLYRELRQRKGRPDKNDELYAQIEGLLNSIVAAGQRVGVEESRRRMQSIADYWSAELWRFDGHSHSGRGSWVLEPFSGNSEGEMDSGDDRDQPNGKEPESAYTLVRLAAASRLWKQFQKDPGFLILGRKAIRLVESIKNDDRQISEFVKASKWQLRRRDITWALMCALLALSSLSLVYVYGTYIPKKIDSAYSLTFSGESYIQGKALHDLSCLISYVPPSSEKLFTRMKLKGTSISGVHFIGANLTQINICNSVLADSSIDYSIFSEAVIRGGEFDNSDFRFSQFQRTIFDKSKLWSTDFTRAIFDHSTFNEVIFDDVNLFQASFSGATFDEPTLKTLSQNAWWLASGWSPSVVERLAKILRRTPLASETLRDSVSYKKAFIERICSLPWPQRTIGQGSTQGSDVASFAGSYNALALFYAQWGIELGAPPLNAESIGCRAPGELRAIDAARMAQVVNEPNYKNTLGYVLLLQAEITGSIPQLQEAIALLQAAAVSDPTLDETGILRALARYKYLTLIQQPSARDTGSIEYELSRIKVAISNPRFTSFDPLYHLTKQLKDPVLLESILYGLDRGSPQQTVPGVHAANTRSTTEVCDSATTAQSTANLKSACNMMSILLPWSQ